MVGSKNCVFVEVDADAQVIRDDWDVPWQIANVFNVRCDPCGDEDVVDPFGAWPSSCYVEKIIVEDVMKVCLCQEVREVWLRYIGVGIH